MGILSRVKKIVIETLIAYYSAISLTILLVSFIRQRSRKLKQKSTEDVESYDTKDGKVSIVIAVKNEARVIGKTLRNLESTTIDKSRCEVIIVDSGCTDNTIEVAKASSCVIPVHFLRSNKGVGRGASLHEGFQKISGDIVLFLRSDAILPPGYDETLRREFSKSKTILASFKFGIDRSSLQGTEPVGLWILETYINLRTRFCLLPGGSQGYAMSAKAYIKRPFIDRYYFNYSKFTRIHHYFKK